ncbi:hypothetical protein BDR07DRAFT_1495366 [Suillus spraguei]|nr:hypothetical protein BDR07DRAFT_1495366 [Suillus spraguei]
MVKDQTFSLSKLVTAVELLCDQQFLTHAHTEAGTNFPDHIGETIAVGYCPGCILRSHRQICYVSHSQFLQASLSFIPCNSPDLPEGEDEAQSVADTSSSVSATSAANVAPLAAAGATAANTVLPSVTTNAAPPASVPMTHGNTSASACGYAITVGCEISVFQGWHVSSFSSVPPYSMFAQHNVHSHVVGIPGACFGWHTSRASVDEAYAQALQYGTVQKLAV